MEFEKQQNREVKSDQANYITKRNELEEFFLQCVEEVKKDIQKRKDIQSRSSKLSIGKSTKASY